MPEIHPLKRWLFDNQMTAADFAARIGVSPAAVSQWIQRHRSPSLEMAIKVRDATNGAVRVEDMSVRASTEPTV
jgi:DNA-binding transcriptional regulator YdaS (Cro superfamily)